MSDFATLLRQHREAKRWSMERLAEEADVDHSLVSRLERDERNPTRISIRHLSVALHLTDNERDALYLSAGLTPPDIDTALLARLIALLREAKEQPTRGDLAA